MDFVALITLQVFFREFCSYSGAAGLTPLAVQGNMKLQGEHPPAYISRLSTATYGNAGYTKKIKADRKFLSAFVLFK